MTHSPPGATDWFAWHADYAEPRSPHSRRVQAVQTAIAQLLPADRPERWTVVSLCAGQGSDVIGALENYPHREAVHARLVEMDERNVEVLRAELARTRLDRIEVVRADAAPTMQYADVVPADLVLLCGIFGNISDADILGTIAVMPQFCVPGGSVIWTRSRRAPDFTPTIRAAFADAGFSETSFVAPDDVEWSVGVERFDGQTQPLQDATLFRFVK
jgi:Putative methyltransferase